MELKGPGEGVDHSDVSDGPENWDGPNIPVVKGYEVKPWQTWCSKKHRPNPANDPSEKGSCWLNLTEGIPLRGHAVCICIKLQMLHMFYA